MNGKSELKEGIVGFLSEASGRPASVNELAAAVGAAGRGREAVKRALKALVADGTVVMTRGGRYALPARINLVTGVLSCHPDGYAFVRPAAGGEDVFVGPGKLSGAMHGDEVAARVEGVKKGGKREGRIVRIIKRANGTVVGRFDMAPGGFGVVVPSDRRILCDVLIPPGAFGGAAAGKMVEAEITAWPRNRVPAAGRVIEVLGAPDDPDVETAVILKKYGLPSRFPHAAALEARRAPEAVREADARGRVDLRGRSVFTIDGESARDFDDAVAVERTKGGYRLFVSIADVGHYVREGSALDAEAYARGTSVYFPGKCVPMLPEELSNGICSLNPGVDRLTLTAEMDFDGRGRPVKRRFYESVIRSVERMTYTKVAGILKGDDAALLERYSGIVGDIRLMDELAALIRGLRFAEGSIDFDLPEPEIILDLEGRVEDILRSQRNVAHTIIEEFMLAANRAVAHEFSSRGLPFIYRVHEPPDAENIDEFKVFAAGLGLKIKGAGPMALQRVLKEAAGRPFERLVNHVLLRSMKQAVYSPENSGHFGLAFKDYTHFTSPIRRYPDLIVHRLLRLHMRRSYGKTERERAGAYLPAAAGHLSARERKAMEAERESVDLKRAQFMKEKVGEEYDAVVSSVTAFGVFVELKDFFVEALVHVSTIDDDYYVYDDRRHTLTGERRKRVFRVGDGVRVAITRVDIELRRIDAVLAGMAAGGRRAVPGGAAGASAAGAGRGRKGAPAAGKGQWRRPGPGHPARRRRRGGR